MTRHPVHVDQPIVNCEVCLNEIPSSEATSAEAQDYVLYFCGLECYTQWQAEGDIDDSDVADIAV